MLLGDAGPRPQPASGQVGDLESVPTETNPGLPLSLTAVRACAHRHAERLGRRVPQLAATPRTPSPAPQGVLTSALLPSPPCSGNVQPLAVRSRSAGCLVIRLDPRPSPAAGPRVGRLAGRLPPPRAGSAIVMRKAGHLR